MILSARILGSGSSGGVPRIGGRDGRGDWGACDPANPRNRRRRCSLLLRQGPADGPTTDVLIDTSPDIRDQLLDAGVGRLDGVAFTHEHADQVNGFDDLRVIAINMRRRVDVWMDEATGESLRRRFGYCFESPAGSAYPPIVAAHSIPGPYGAFDIAGAGGTMRLQAIDLDHGGIRSLGFRVGGLAYAPDVVDIPEASFAYLEGLDCFIIDALRYRPHPTHAHVEKALSWIARLRPRRAILTNLHVDLDYERLARELPPGVEPAFDGLTVTCPV